MRGSDVACGTWEFLTNCRRLRVLVDCEEKHGVSAIELMGLLWGLEYFRCYVYGENFIRQQIINFHSQY